MEATKARELDVVGRGAGGWCEGCRGECATSSSVGLPHTFSSATGTKHEAFTQGTRQSGNS